jgi:hypothetical protein
MHIGLPDTLATVGDQLAIKIAEKRPCERILSQRMYDVLHAMQVDRNEDTIGIGYYKQSQAI